MYALMAWASARMAMALLMIVRQSQDTNLAKKRFMQSNLQSDNSAALP